MTRYAYKEFSSYSPLLDCEAVRLSVTDAHGGEFFKIIPAQDGKSWRLAREKALCQIVDAIDAGDQPGEVRAP